ncbi:MAG: hypothetical protein ACYC6H_11445 [Bellilinea sp.]
MEGPANTVSYFVAGYVVIFGIMGFYLASLIVRWHNLTQDEEMLNELEKKETDQG